MTEYCFYGVPIIADFALFDRPLPSAVAAPWSPSPLELILDSRTADLTELTHRMSLGASHGRALWLYTDRKLAQSKKDQPWCMEVEGIVTFHWSGSSPVITCALQDDGTSSLLTFWCVHVFLPLYLSLQHGYDFLHAAAVEIDQRPVLLVAPSGGGKSTLADYFMRQGHVMLSDDKVSTALHEGEFWVAPSHPHHRPYRENETLGNPLNNFADQARPVHTIYTLEAGAPDCAFEFTEAFGFRKFEKLLPNYMFDFDFLRKKRVRWLANLADQTSVYQLRRPWNMERLHESYEALLFHARSVG